MTTKEWPAESARANSTAIRFASSSVPSYLTSALPDASQKDTPNFAPGIELAKVS
jgi:hypothetical protein